MLPKFLILFAAWIAVVMGTMILGVSKIIHEASCQHRQIINQQIDDSHKLHEWRLK